ncbi:prolyl-tRNA synthetase [Neurospora crassa]|uniref:proline--tRNA ligase n=1 Tax=Neurospora crassa (strain ATCC 24698 / 74-OR23-1A / CBS 708.71 / DSM 1257 / FGSC 987) TaxID=367110 RepID=Q7S207_NEUCR|nr:prolyl-tRNA synthetase [Neurospora crassa OR74A]EAA29381.3 prolyl-tRNA synthetase [Neurospora crassa OR74A]KHE80261.1 prolyl-tRNA synthetase [Neurospora crassa]|eukprot:XP_958617.3 prolyl-tRNA synthetase [Neurospora crassa OR74A]
MLPRSIPRLSKVWIPSGGFAVPGVEDAHSKLVRAGFLRQSHAGIFHMLPLGKRVQDKVERLVAKHMEESLAASRVSLSSISSEALWERSGRLPNIAPELFRFPDRKGSAYLLSPTHEEEITYLVAQTVRSYKDLPLRLYQITRKFRDELRPRHGLLRGREFIMKDLYTFDTDLTSALDTYEKVRAAYSRIFNDMKLPVLAAKASSGDMGGDLSHEYHLPSPFGEDNIITCGSCDYIINEEIATTKVAHEICQADHVGVWRAITKDRSTLVNVWYPTRTIRTNTGQVREYTNSDINIYAIKPLVPDLDASVSDATEFWAAATEGPDATAKQLVNLFDSRLPPSFSDSSKGSASLPMWPDTVKSGASTLHVQCHGSSTNGGKPLNFLRIRKGDNCPQCSSGTLNVQKAMELGHTFHLGTRYSQPLGAKISLPPPSSSEAKPSTGDSGTSKTVSMQMGCHGIGISRVIGAVAEHLADDKGLNWPVAIAPYTCIVVFAEDNYDDAVEVYKRILNGIGDQDERLDIILDDRQKSLPWKLKDADLIGAPVIVVLGREWRIARRVEVQCRRLNINEVIDVNNLPSFIAELHLRL